MTQERAGQWEFSCWRLYSPDDKFFSILSTSDKYPGCISCQNVSDTAKSLTCMLELMMYIHVLQSCLLSLDFSSGALRA